MATRYTPQQIKDQYEKLPEALKQALYSAELAEKMFELGKRHGLTMEKTGFMSEEAGFVVLGLTPPRAFARALAERLGIPADAAEKIALEISHEIFFPLREALKQTHQIEVGEGAMVKNEGLGIRSEGLGQQRSAPPMSEPIKTAPITPTQQAPAPTPIPKPILPSPTILSAEVSPPPMPPVPSKPETPKTPEDHRTEISKKMPPALRAVTDNLEKEIAPLIGGIRDDRPRGFLSQEEVTKLIAERQIENKDIGVREEGLGTAKPVSPIPSALPPATEVEATPPIPPAPQQKNSIDLRASAHPPAPPPPPAIPINPKIPPIDLRAAPPKEPPQEPPKPAPEKTRPYQGYDPYREPIE